MDKYLQMDKGKLITLVQSAFAHYRPKPAKRVYFGRTMGKCVR